MATVEGLRLDAEANVDHPHLDDSPNRAARSPPPRSASATRTTRSVGHVAPTRHASVVTPGAPLTDAMAITVTRANRSLPPRRCRRADRRRMVHGWRPRTGRWWW